MADQETLESRLVATNYRPSAFDYMRVSLACSIVIWHTAKINYGNAFELEIWNGPARPLLGLILPMFFALSGFLVAGSYERCKTVVSFVFLRSIRIFPALIFETLISALLIGPIFTDLDISSYFQGKPFFSYFLNIIGDVHYFLPGVFAHNPSPNTVNGQLWTVPFELRCYILIALLSMFGLAREAWRLLLVFVVLQIFMLQRASVYGEVSAAVPGNVLVLCFLAGFIFFRVRKHVTYSFQWFTLAVAIHIMLYIVKFGDYFVAVPDAYITIYIGLLNPPKLGLLRRGDYSYGIFLYGFVIQQSVAALGDWTHDWRISLTMTAPILLLAAVVSWHGLESRVLGLKKWAGAIDRKIKGMPFPKSMLLIEAPSTSGQGAVAPAAASIP